MFEGNLEGEYVPSEQDLARLKNQMIIKARRFRREHNLVHSQEVEIRRESQISDLKN